MKQTFFCCGMIIAQLAALQAAPRDLNQARQCASSFLASRQSALSAEAATLRMGGEQSQPKTTNPQPYYLFEDVNHQGFVVVSGSDRMNPIVGYGDTPLDPKTLSPSFQYWLDCLEQRVEHLEKHPEVEVEQEQRQTTAIFPLLGGIAWDQGYPYNLHCPKTNQGYSSVTGCVATAMAQVVYYYRYPSQGYGFHTDINTPVSVNFSAQTYDYSLMVNQSIGNFSEAIHNEMSKLSYHCGVMSNTNYGAGFSTASEDVGLLGLIRYFHYDPDGRSMDHEQYTKEQWDDLLINELRNDRPIIYSGYSEHSDLWGGHCFVLDGIDSQGLYHVNWGWGGKYNGYFDIDILNPMKDGPEGYHRYCSALIQVAPEGCVKNAVYYGELDSKYGMLQFYSKPRKAGDVFAIFPTGIGNSTVLEATVRMGLAFVQKGDTMAYAMNDTIRTYAGITEPGTYETISENIFITMPELPDGDYDVELCYERVSGKHDGVINFIRFNPLWTRPYTCSIRGGVVSIYSEWDMPDSIESLSTDTPAPPHGSYDITGRLIPDRAPLAPGLYIKDGKKVQIQRAR